MSPRTAARLAWTLWGVYLVLGGLAVALSIYATPYNDQAEIDPPWFTAIFILGLAGFATSGALVASRRPGNPIGWLMCGIALFWVLEVTTDIAAELAGVRPGSIPAPELISWLSQWIWIPALGIGAVFLPLLFPNGRLLSPRWRVVGYAAACGLGLTIAGNALASGLMTGGFVNPVGLDVPGLRIIRDLGTALFVASTAAAILSVVLRFRRARGVERQQLKWFVYAMAPAAIAVGVASLVGLALDSELAGGVAWGVTLISLIIGVPIATGIAILRYRLYEIDLIVRRTLVYGVLSVLLAGLYFGIVLALQQVFSSFTGGSDLAIAVSTLAVAGLFRPVRARLQAFVDRRFYRRRYDATQTLESFNARLRDEIDLDALGQELRSVVHETMQPAHVSLWLRLAEAPTVTFSGRSPSTKELR